MADMRPFCAYRPAPGMESKIAALPYDVYNREEATEAVRANPDSFLAIDRAETGFGPEVDTYSDLVYGRAAELLRDRISRGYFLKEDRPCYYLYELTMNGRSQTGIAACASIDDYCNNIIKKHENTRTDKEQDRIRHVDACSMHTGPIFLAYRSNESLRSIVREVKEETPVYDFVSEDGIGHRVWVIGGTDRIENIRREFGRQNAVYIADGHHRCASAVKVGLRRREQNPGYTGEEEFNYFLSVLFPEDELYIMDYNRVVSDLNGYTKEEFLRKTAENFEVEKAAETPCRPKEKGCFGMYLGGTWYLLRAKPHTLSQDAVEGLDVSVLQNYLLDPVLGIRDPRTDKRIDFVGGIRGLKELERRVQKEGDPDIPAHDSAGQENCGVAFSMYPTSIQELFAVADSGRLMPPKSTWFEPKLRSGLFLHSL